MFTDAAPTATPEGKREQRQCTCRVLWGIATIDLSIGRKQNRCKGREERCSEGGEGGAVAQNPFAQPPPPLLPACLAAVLGGGVRRGGMLYLLYQNGGGGSTPQHDLHVALIIFDYTFVGGGGLLEKAFSGQILCPGAFGGNLHFYAKQRAWHGTPFLQTPPPLLRRPSVPPLTPPAEQFSGRQGTRHESGSACDSLMQRHHYRAQPRKIRQRHFAPFPIGEIVPWRKPPSSRPGVFVMTAYGALIRPSGEDAMGRSCILDSPPPPRQGDARGNADAGLS